MKRVFLLAFTYFAFVSCSKDTASTTVSDSDAMITSLDDISSTMEVDIEQEDQIASNLDSSSFQAKSGSDHCGMKFKIITFKIVSDKMHDGIQLRYHGYDYYKDFEYIAPSPYTGSKSILKDGIISKNHHITFKHDTGNEWYAAGELASYREDGDGFRFHYALVNGNYTWRQFPKWSSCGGKHFVKDLTKSSGYVIE